jgi:hypothetical protein
MLRDLNVKGKSNGEYLEPNSDGSINTTSSTDSSEVQEINDQKHQRTFAPEENILLTQILKELKQIRQHLEIITDEETL